MTRCSKNKINFNSLFAALCRDAIYRVSRHSNKKSAAFFARGIVAAAKPYQADRSAPSRTSGATVRVGGAGMSEANRE
jgi:hypothetical protein